MCVSMIHSPCTCKKAFMLKKDKAQFISLLAKISHTRQIIHDQTSDKSILLQKIQIPTTDLSGRFAPQCQKNILNPWVVYAVLIILIDTFTDAKLFIGCNTKWCDLVSSVRNETLKNIINPRCGKVRCGQVKKRFTYRPSDPTHETAKTMRLSILICLNNWGI